MTRRWIPIALAGLLAAVYATAFLSMAWIRAQQGHGGQVLPSEIEKLAVREEPPNPLDLSQTRGRKIYEHYCGVCHGVEGKGDGPNSGPLIATLQTHPQNFTDPAFWKAKGTTEERLHDAVSEGGQANGKSLLMPAWGNTLTDSQVRDVITFVRTFAAQPKTQSE